MNSGRADHTGVESISALPSPADENALRTGLPKRRRWLAVWQGLLWAEWFAHSKLLLVFLGVWLVSVWTVPLFAHPGWLLLLGGLYALFAGPAYGGGDVLDGAEEFIFSLPPTRAQRYTARFAVGAGSLVFLTIINLTALGFDLPQVLAGMYVKSGLITPAPIPRPGWLYALVLAFPLAVFSFSFILSALTHSRVLILTAWFWGLLASLAILKLCFSYEDLVAGKLTGFFACPTLFSAAAGAIALGCYFYQRKEVTESVIPLVLPGLWWLWILLFVAGLAVVLSLTYSLVQLTPQLLVEAGPR